MTAGELCYARANSHRNWWTHAIKTVAHIAPPPPAFSVVSRAILGGIFLAALFLGAPAEAQTDGTVTLSATGNNGDRDATAPGLQVDEGDEITVTVTAHGLTAGTIGIDYNYAGTAASVADYHDRGNPARVDTGDTVDAVGGGVTSNHFTIRDDTIAEADETIIITLTNISLITGTIPFTSTDTLMNSTCIIM